MIYGFKDITTDSIYNTARVMFITGKNVTFNNYVGDTLKQLCQIDTAEIVTTKNANTGIFEEFGIEVETDEDDSDIGVNSVDFDTFLEVINVVSINGKWFCRADYHELRSGKRKEKLEKYIKNPSDNGMLVITSMEWSEYRELLRNRVIRSSKNTHLIELSYPTKDALKEIVESLFADRGLKLGNEGKELFILKMGNRYDEYETVINSIASIATDSGIIEKVESIEDIDECVELGIKQLKEFMKGIEYYILPDFVRQLTTPLTSDKTNSKKILRVMAALIEENGAVALVRKLIKIINECIEFRVYMNKGIIPVGMNYFYKEVLRDMPESYEKMPEWKFKRKAELAVCTSLRDWIYMKLILESALVDETIGEELKTLKCKRALYDVCTRSVLTPDRINNLIGIDNILCRMDIDKIVYTDTKMEG